MNPINILALKNFPFVEPDDDLASIIDKSISLNNIKIDDSDVFIIAQKKSFFFTAYFHLDLNLFLYEKIFIINEM